MWQELKTFTMRQGARFLRDRRGGILILLALGIIPLVAGVGLAIDTSRGYMLRAKLNAAADAAALAGARSVQTEDWDEDVDRYFAANFPNGYMGATVAPLVRNRDTAAMTVEVTASASMPTTFLRLLSVNDFNVKSYSKVSGERRGLELALVLDVTGSMQGSKLTALQDAVDDLLDELFGSNASLDDLYVSVVPFNGRVNVGAARKSWFNFSFLIGNDVCGNPRSASLAVSDDTVSAGKWWSYQWASGSPSCPSAAVLPLNNVKQTISNYVNALTANGNTRTDIGAVWGWRTISPKWRGQWGSGTYPLDYDTPLMDKAVIIMTDGENTPSDGTSEATTYTRLGTICTNMKDAGISVYTITFATPASLSGYYSSCASNNGAGTYFDSPSEEDLKAAFNAIARQLTNIRIVQ